MHLTLQAQYPSFKIKELAPTIFFFLAVLGFEVRAMQVLFHLSYSSSLHQTFKTI
jgi:hypothetical protein